MPNADLQRGRRVSDCIRWKALLAAILILINIVNCMYCRKHHKKNYKTNAERNKYRAIPKK